MTPRVTFDATSITGGISAGDDVDITLRMECLSPRLGSKEAISVLNGTGTELTSLMSIGADQTLVLYPSFALPEDLDADGYVIMVGCNFTGYTQFLLTTGAPVTTVDSTLLLAVGLGTTIIIVAVVIVIFMRKKA
jgi:hypothetical protein